MNASNCCEDPTIIQMLYGTALKWQGLLLAMPTGNQWTALVGVVGMTFQDNQETERARTLPSRMQWTALILLEWRFRTIGRRKGHALFRLRCPCRLRCPFRLRRPFRLTCPSRLRCPFRLRFPCRLRRPFRLRCHHDSEAIISSWFSPASEDKKASSTLLRPKTTIKIHCGYRLRGTLSHSIQGV